MAQITNAPGQMLDSRYVIKYCDKTVVQVKDITDYFTMSSETIYGSD